MPMGLGYESQCTDHAVYFEGTAATEGPGLPFVDSSGHEGGAHRSTYSAPWAMGTNPAFLFPSPRPRRVETLRDQPVCCLLLGASTLLEKWAVLPVRP